MSVLDSPDLMSLGQQCSVMHCRQNDFLPFKCDCCHKIFCLEHRTYARHDCPSSRSKSSTTIICPLCACAVKVADGEDPNTIFERHTKAGCDPTNYAKVMQKKKCPVPNCKEKLTTINTYTCKACATAVCLRHRFQEDHSCRKILHQGQKAQNGTNSLLKFLGLDSKQPPADKLSSQVQSGALKQSNKALWSGPIRAAEQRSKEQQMAHSDTREICSICNLGFDTLAELISHSEMHASNLGGASAREVCPQCQAVFQDPVALVEHVERSHNKKSACVLS